MLLGHIMEAYLIVTIYYCIDIISVVYGAQHKDSN